MKFAFALAAVVVATSVVGVAHAGVYGDWGHGVAGYNDLAKSAVKKETPLILLFHTEWCGWCKKLESDLLASAQVSSGLAKFAKVEINPELGEQDKELSKRYGVTGYPTFLVTVPALSKEIRKISPFPETGILSPEKFLDLIKKAAASFYLIKGDTCLQARDYKQALDWYERALSYHPKFAPVYYGIGLANHNMGAAAHDIVCIQQAQKSYEQALEIDPNFKPAQEQLDKLKAAQAGSKDAVAELHGKGGSHDEKGFKKGAGSSHTVKKDTSPAVKKGTAHTVKKDTSPAVKKDTAHTVKKDTSPVGKGGPVAVSEDQNGVTTFKNH